MTNIPLLAVSQEVYTIGIFIGAIFVILLIMEIQICQLRFRVIDLEKGSSPTTDKPNDLLSAEGVTTTTLELSGIANINGKKVDVISEGEKISKNTRIKVTGVKGISYIIEAIILYVIIMLIGFRLGNPGFVGYDFHPFYFVILLITLRYGYRKSIYTMILAGSLYSLFYILKSSHFNYYDLFDACYQPIAFLAFWLFLGLIVDLDKKKIITLSEEKKQLKQTISHGEAEIEKINSLNEKISEELSKSSKGFSTLFDTTKSLFNEDVMVLYRTAYDVLNKIIGTSKAYVFYLDDDDFKLAAPKDIKMDLTNLVSSEKIDEVRKSHKFIRLDMQDENMISDNEPVFIGPIIHDATDTLYGLIVVEELDFLKYNKNTFRSFKNLCKWVGDILYFRTKQSNSIVPQENNNEFNYVVKFGTTQQQIREIVENAFIEK